MGLRGWETSGCEGLLPKESLGRQVRMINEGVEKSDQIPRVRVLSKPTWWNAHSTWMVPECCSCEGLEEYDHGAVQEGASSHYRPLPSLSEGEPEEDRQQ